MPSPFSHFNSVLGLIKKEIESLNISDETVFEQYVISKMNDFEKEVISAFGGPDSYAFDICVNAYLELVKLMVRLGYSEAALDFAKGYRNRGWIGNAEQTALDNIRLRESSDRSHDKPREKGGKTRSRTAVDPPLSTFDGWLKCIRSENLNELGIAALYSAFPGFLELEKASEEASQRLNHMVETGIETIAWSGKTPRRYAGDDDVGLYSLPRRCYYTISRDESGEDGHTLANELMAYATQESGEVYSYDAGSTFVSDGKGRRNAIVVIFRSRPHRYNPFLSVCEKYGGQSVERLAKSDVLVELPYIVSHTCIPGVLDLRLPTPREWLWNTFSRGDGVFLKRLMFDEEQIQEGNFFDLLPTLLDIRRGGNETTQAIGGWLRDNGVNALIFPSARTDFFCRLENGEISLFHGWNLVDYRDAPPIKPKHNVVYGPWETKSVYTHLTYGNTGDTFEGSLRGQGSEQAQKDARFRQVERFYERKFDLNGETVSLDDLRQRLSAGLLSRDSYVYPTDNGEPSGMLSVGSIMQ